MNFAEMVLMGIGSLVVGLAIVGGAYYLRKGGTSSGGGSKTGPDQEQK